MTSTSEALVASRLCTCSGEIPQRGARLGEVAVLPPGGLAWEDGIIT